MQDFYAEVLTDLLRTGVLDTGMKVLVLCGGKTDRAVLRRTGFTDVVISNIGTRPKDGDLAPFEWAYQDAERLTYDDGTFDLCVVHSGLHHCHSPHRALLEMYRVARRGVLLFEPYDNLLTRLGVRFNVGQEYEHASLSCNGCHAGGVGNTTIPNFVYRFTEQEIVKAIHCYAPYARHDIRFFHRMRLPMTQLRQRRNKTLYHAVRLARPALRMVELCAPRQSNNFAAFVAKPDLARTLHPWLRHDDGAITLNEHWVADRYGR